MQWTVVKVFLVLLTGIQFCFPQTFIVKFKSEVKDSSEAFSVLAKSLPKGKLYTALSSAAAIQPIAKNSRSKFLWSRYSILRFHRTTDPQLFSSLSSNPNVEYIHPSYSYNVYSVPNDSAYAEQWNLRRIGISKLHEADQIHQLLPLVKVGIVDTGIDTDHPDLRNVIAINDGETGNDSFNNDKRSNGVDDDNNGFIDDWRGYDFVDLSTEDIGDWNERDNDPTDENGHGTGVAGIIGAQSNNSIGLSGISPCALIPLRAFGKGGSGSDVDIASAIVYAVDNGAEVINMSFGDVVRSPILFDAIQYAYENNVVLVASSGNDGSTLPHYPSDFSEVISTGSVNRFDMRSIFSSHSPALDIMAPGEEIITTMLNGRYTNNFSGTSAAAPHVSGVVALMKSIEQQKINANTAYVPLSNEEMRGILVNSADDAGVSGWDNDYASGIVNAEKALEAIAGSRVLIHSPQTDEIVTDNFVNVIVTAATPYLKTVSLFYGQGNDPQEWHLISTIENRILLKDTIRFLEKILLPDDTYILRLVVHNSKGNDAEYRQRFFLQRNTPKILSLTFHDSVIMGSEYGVLIEARIDRNCIGNLYYRKIGEVEYSRIQSIGLQKNHYFTLTAKEFSPNIQYEVYCEFIENSVEQRSVKFFLTDSIGSSIILSSQSIPSTGFGKKTYSLPAGYLLNSVQRIADKPTLVLNEYSSAGDFGKLKTFEFNGNVFVQNDSSGRSWIPRAYIKDVLLVQERGISQLLKIDTSSAQFFKQPLWGDSSDVWASTLIDLNGDTQPEIITRSSSEYLIYKNLGNNIFSLISHLPNPSFPLEGESQNQFGPPRVAVGDFTNSGLKEIIFADYDGDLILYRQVNAALLDFVLVSVDTSDLFEMSDFITAGDFNGDGISDFAVAGHSNLNWNADREYDVPVWTVRVFSHQTADPTGTVSKIWEQHFVGVKSGRGFDNGLLNGKLKTNDSHDALFLSLNPYLYIFKWNPIKQTFEAQWIHSSQSNSLMVYDFDNDGMNDFGFHTNAKTEFWSLENSASIVQTPWGLSAASLSADKVRLQWNSSFSTHKIYRGTSQDTLSYVSTVAGIEWIDSTVTSNEKYYYAVTAFSTTESQHSSIISTIPHASPFITNVIQVSPSQLRVELSFDVSSEKIFGTQFLLDDTLFSTTTVWESSREFLVTFAIPIQTGNRKLKIKKLVDASGMEGDTTQTFFFTAGAIKGKEFFVRSVSLASQNTILVEFSEQPYFTEALRASNYSVKNIAKSFFIARVDSLSPRSVKLIFSSAENLSAIALRVEVKISENITSENGVKLMEGKGQVLSIAQEIESIDNIVVYPNPVRNNQHVTFVNIPANCRITLFSLTGEKIKIFDDLTTSEGVAWNLVDEKGNQLSSGIYIYRVEKLDNAGAVTNTILGKFAVIR